MVPYKNIFIFIVSFCCSFSAFSQSITGDIEVHLNNMVSSIPGSSGNNYTSPTASELLSWENTVTEILNGNIVAARIIADSFNYQVVEYTDNTIATNPIFYILEERVNPSNYWGTYVFNSTPCRENLVLQAPHPKFDFNTGRQSIFCYKRLSAKVLFLSGAHRCNHTTSSSCSGSTSSCSGSYQPFRISDMAHNTSTIFQKTTETVSSQNNNSVFVQLHGFTKTSSDPYVIMSNGTRATPITDYVTLIKNELANLDNSLSFKLAHIDITWTKLIAFTNTQGRFLNGSVSPCNISASSTSGKFVHVEQEKTKLRNDSIGWNKMYLALSNVFSCSPAAITESSSNRISYKIYPSPVQNNLTIEATKINHVELVDMSGRILFSKNYSGISQITLKINTCAKGLIFVIVYANNELITKKIVVQ